MGYVAAQIFKRAIERNNHKCCCCCSCKKENKPKRYEIKPAKDIWPNAAVSGYVVWAPIGGVVADTIPTFEAAELIAAIYEEVMQ